MRPIDRRGARVAERLENLALRNGSADYNELSRGRPLRNAIADNAATALCTRQMCRRGALCDLFTAVLHHPD